MVGIKNKKVIGVDLGGTHLRVSLIKGGKIIKYLKKETPKEKDALIAELFNSIFELVDKEVKGIGVASPGPLKEGIIKNPPNLPLRDYNLKKELEKRFKLPVEVANDADCVAIAEAQFGVKKKDFIILTLGTGIGGGIIINNKLYTGAGYAGEVGQIIIDKNTGFEKLWQKSRGKCKKYFGEKFLIRDLLKMRNKKAKEFLGETVDILGKGIASLIVVLDPDVVVLAGGVRETGNKFLNMIKKKVEDYSRLPKITPIQWTRLAHPGTLGASLLVNGLNN